MTHLSKIMVAIICVNKGNPPTAIIFQSHDPHPVPALQDCSIIQSSLFEKERKNPPKMECPSRPPTHQLNP